MGLQLATIEAVQRGGVLEYGREGEDSWRVVRDVLFERVDLTRLSQPDQQLLSQALIGDEE